MMDAPNGKPVAADNTLVGKGIYSARPLKETCLSKDTVAFVPWGLTIYAYAMNIVTKPKRMGAP